MKSFVFIIPRTPVKFQSEIRNKLFKICVRSLMMQLHNDWEAIVVDEFDCSYDNINHVKSDAVKKHKKIDFALKLVLQESVKPRYLIRLDDDDIISPIAIQRYCSGEYDCYTDKYHFFYELISGKRAFQKRTWIPNTAIHKYDHAMKIIPGEESPLINTDHSKYWLDYYRKYQISFLPRKHPLYMRVLSPFSITSGGVGLSKKSLSDNLEYQKYLKGFGRFRNYNIREYELFFKMIKIILG